MINQNKNTPRDETIPVLTPLTLHYCENCGQPFYGREDAKFDSPSCRQAAYRNRKNKTDPAVGNR